MLLDTASKVCQFTGADGHAAIDWDDMKPEKTRMIIKRSAFASLAIIGAILIGALIHEVVTARSDVARLHEGNASLKAQAESLQAEAESLQAEAESLTSEIESLQMESETSKQRIAVLQRSVNSVLRRLPPTALDSCLRDRQVLTDFHLGVLIDSTDKVIDHRQLIELSARDDDWEVAGIYHDQESLADDFAALSGIEIDTRGDATHVIKDDVDNASRAFDFIAVLRDEQGNDCAQPIRLHFAQSAEKLKGNGWRIESVIGRSGLGLGRFSLPYGTQFHDGHLWTTDCSNENVSIFSLDGRFKGSFGQFGTRLGKLDTPAALSIVGEHVYVVEERNHRVQKFTLDGSPVDVIGTFKSTEDPLLYQDKFNSPLGIAWNGEQLAVVDYGNNRIIGIDPERGYAPVWVSGNLSEQDPIQWTGPYYIRWFADQGVFVVSNRGANEIVVMGPTGEKLRAIGTDLLSSPHELDIDSSGNIVVADMRNHRVAIFRSSDDYRESTAEYIDFPKSYGLPKTLTVLPDDRISVGFVGNGTAYFLVLARSGAMQTDLTDARTVSLGAPIDPDPTVVVPEVSNTDAKLEMQARAVYSMHCSSCHENGDYNAPARGNIESWDGFSRDINVLLDQAIEGKGAMIPRGGCVECSDELLRATIEFMLPMTWDRDLAETESQ